MLEQNNLYKGFGYHKDFNSMEKLAKYLGRIKGIEEAHIEQLRNGNWRLHWNLESIDKNKSIEILNRIRIEASKNGVKQSPKTVRPPKPMSQN